MSTDRFQRIVERMTKELADTIHDDCTAMRRRGIGSGGSTTTADLKNFTK